MPPRAVDFSRVGQMLFAEISIVGEQLRKAENRVQRCTQFVAHAGEKLGLGLTRLFRLVPGLYHRGLGLLALGNVLVNRDHALPGILVAAHQGHDGTGFEVRAINPGIDAFHFVIFFVAGKRCNLGRIVLGPLRVPPLIDIGFNSEKLLQRPSFMHAK